MNKAKKEKYVTYAVFTNTLESLNQRFDGIDKHFEAIGARFDAIDQRFGAIDQRFDGIDQRFGAVALVIDKNSRDIARLQETVATRADIDALNSRFDHFAGEFKGMYNHTYQLPYMVNDLLSRVNEHDVRLADLESKIK